MTTELYEDDNCMLTTFYAGAKRGVMLQFTCKHYSDYVTLSPSEMDEICRVWTEYKTAHLKPIKKGPEL